MLDGLLKKQIRNDVQMAGMLASYNRKPAFFYQKSPVDTDVLWRKPCYPRVDYNIDMLYNPERKTNGILTINVWCSSESQAMPEEIEKRLREIIDGAFYSVAEQNTICAKWNRSDAFSFEGNKGNLNNDGQPEIFGITLTFELTEFPPQFTTDPDPVQGINKWTKINFPDLTITAHDALPPIWKPTDKNPAVYWRFIGADSDDSQSSYSVTWFEGQFAAHIITDSVDERNRRLKAVAEHLQTYGEIILSDSSPMFVKKIQINHNADPLHDGQIIITGRYGVLTGHRKEEAQIKLNEVNYTRGDKMSKITANKENIQKEIILKNTMTALYSAAELAKASRNLFKTTPEAVQAAFKQIGKTEATVEEAKEIVNNFLHREVK